MRQCRKPWVPYTAIRLCIQLGPGSNSGAPAPAMSAARTPLVKVSSDSAACGLGWVPLMSSYPDEAPKAVLTGAYPLKANSRSRMWVPWPAMGYTAEASMKRTSPI